MKRIIRIDEMIAALAVPDFPIESVRAVVSQFMENEPEVTLWPTPDIHAESIRYVEDTPDKELLDRIFGPLPSPAPDPVAAIKTLREFFQEAYVCGVHSAITDRINDLERHVKMVTDDRYEAIE